MMRLWVSNRSRRVPVILLAFLWAWALGCGEQQGERDQTLGADNGASRGVCLLPAATSHLVAMGLEDRLVGRAAWDPVAPESLPVVSSNALDHEALLKADPDWVIVSSMATGPDLALLSLAEEAGFSVFDYRYPESINDALALLTVGDSDTPSMGEALNMQAEADALAKEIQMQLEAVRQAGETAAARNGPLRVLAVFSLEPVIALGPATVVDELITTAGGINALATPGTGKTVQLDHENLFAINPDLILILEPNGPPLTAGDPRTQAIRSVPIWAVENERLVLVNHPQALLSGAHIGTLAETFLSVFWPETEAHDSP